MWKQLLVRFDLSDADIRTINRLRKFGLYNVQMSDDATLSFWVSLVHKSAVSRILGKRTYSIKEYNNMFTVMNFFYTRITLIITAIACITAFVVSEQFVFRIRLIGLGGEEYTQVSHYLKSRDIKAITLKRKARNPNLAFDIVNEFPFAAFVDIYIQGSKLTVFVGRADNVLPLIPVNDIITEFDGVIADIVVFSGTALVTVGDVVRKGDVLVTGMRPTAIITITNGAEVICIINNTVV